jgi:hypothetical protein
MYVQKQPMFKGLKNKKVWTRPDGCRITEEITPWLVAGMFVSWFVPLDAQTRCLAHLGRR